MPQLTEKEYQDLLAQAAKGRSPQYADINKKQAELDAQLSEDAKITRQSELLKGLRNKDLAEGGAAADKIFTPGVLGRLDDTKGDIKTLFEKRRANLTGYTPQEQQAMREENVGELKRDSLASQRELQRSQGRNRVYGATASAQQAGVQRGLQSNLADQERKLFLDNIANKRQALSDFEKTAVDTQQYNIGQKNKELQGKLTTQLGYAGLGTTERASVMGQILGDKQLQANLANQGGGKK